MQRRIDFLIIGAQKAGTTSFYQYLGEHPEIFMPRVKEVHYFTRDEFYSQGESYLAVFYREAGSEQLLGGADVDLMYFPYAAERVRAHNPRIRVIALLRNPVARAYSAYWFARHTGREKCRTFEEALAKEEERLSGIHGEQSALTYLSHGHYSEQLKRYIRELGRERILVVFTDDLSTRRRDTMLSALNWLGVSPDLRQINLGQTANVSGRPRLPILEPLLRSGDWWFKRTLRRLTSPDVRYFLRRHVSNPLLVKNIRPFTYPPMNPETRSTLREYFAPHNAELSALLGRDLSHWD